MNCSRCRTGDVSSGRPIILRITMREMERPSRGAKAGSDRFNCLPLVLHRGTATTSTYLSPTSRERSLQVCWPLEGLPMRSPTSRSSTCIQYC